MGVQNRLKGLDCGIVFAGPDGGEDSLQKFRSFEITFDAEILKEDYIGEDAPDTDDVSNGIGVKAVVVPNDPDVFDFIDRVERRRRRLSSAAGKFSATGRFVFPEGQTRRIVIPDIAWGAFPIKVSGRKEYVNLELDGAAKRARIIK